MLSEPRLLTFDIPDSDHPDSTHRLVCYQWGNTAAKHTVLCVHGLTRNGRDFDFLAADLSSDYQVLCPDMPGRGKSDWLKNPQAYANTNYLSDIAWMLHSLHIEKVHWIGTSMGGIIGLMAANTLPGFIQTLMLNDIGCLIPATGLARIRDIADLPTVFPTRLAAETAFRKRTATFGINSETQWQHLFRYGLEEKDNTIRFTYDPAIFTAGFSKDTPLTDIDLWPLWEEVKKIPVLLIRGSQSDILPRATALEMQSRHPDFTCHEVENVGHAPSLMDYKEIALIHEWISAKQETTQKR